RSDRGVTEADLEPWACELLPVCPVRRMFHAVLLISDVTQTGCHSAVQINQHGGYDEMPGRSAERGRKVQDKGVRPCPQAHRLANTRSPAHLRAALRSILGHLLPVQPACARPEGPVLDPDIALSR